MVVGGGVSDRAGERDHIAADAVANSQRTGNDGSGVVIHLAARYLQRAPCYRIAADSATQHDGRAIRCRQAGDAIANVVGAHIQRSRRRCPGKGDAGKPIDRRDRILIILIAEAIAECGRRCIAVDVSRRSCRQAGIQKQAALCQGIDKAITTGKGRVGCGPRSRAVAAKGRGQPIFGGVFGVDAKYQPTPCVTAGVVHHQRACAGLVGKAVAGFQAHTVAAGSGGVEHRAGADNHPGTWHVGAIVHLDGVSGDAGQGHAATAVDIAMLERSQHHIARTCIERGAAGHGEKAGAGIAVSRIDARRGKARAGVADKRQVAIVGSDVGVDQQGAPGFHGQRTAVAAGVVGGDRCIHCNVVIGLQAHAGAGVEQCRQLGGRKGVIRAGVVGIRDRVGKSAGAAGRPNDVKPPGTRCIGWR